MLPRSLSWQHIHAADTQKDILFFGNINTSSFTYHLASASWLNINRRPIIFTPDEPTKKYLIQDLQSFFPEANIIDFSPYDVSPYSGLIPQRQAAQKRVKFLSRLLSPELNDIFIMNMHDCCQKVAAPNLLAKSQINLRANGEIPEDFYEVLDSNRYTQTDLVEDIGHYSIKGGILDIYSPHHNFPVRIELFGDQIESLRFFDPQSQLSLSTTTEYKIIPCGEITYANTSQSDLNLKYHDDLKVRKVNKDLSQSILRAISRKQYFPEIDFLSSFMEEDLVSIFNYIDNKHWVWIYDNIQSSQNVDLFYSEQQQLFKTCQDQAICPSLEKIFLHPDEVKNKIPDSKVLFNSIKLQDEHHHLELPSRTISIDTLKKAFHSSSDKKYFFDQIANYKEEGYTILITCNTLTKQKRLSSLFHEAAYQIEVLDEDQLNLEEVSFQQKRDNAKLLHLYSRSIHESFVNDQDKFLFFSESFFYGKSSKKSPAQKSSGLAQKIDRLHFADLKTGDKVVHISHGVAIFDGMKELSINGVKTELLQLSYRDQDILYLPIYRIHQIQKFSGGGGLDKLGTNHWEKTKIKVKSSLRDIASELLNIYAKRVKMKKVPFPPVNHSYYEFEDLFPYEETEDQLKAIESVLTDLTSDKPMDRLVCGDVGFGKTEIALRAAFKAADNKRQVIVLAPTTILAFQHFETFSKRFKNTEFKIRMLSRFTKKADAQETILGLKSGSVDIVIGTHRLLSNDISFFNLGLLIIDEEHRFGVVHKEKIRKFKVGIDTLAMSATPIPRTLNMSLMGIRDLSLIATAPEDRLPIRTYICKQNFETIRKAIQTEVSRGGQVYFLHNRVQSIYQREQELKELMPDIKIRVGHGQMKEDELEKIMIAFFRGDFDVFLCTTIIESGIDNPRANTMIIDDAHKFGLSQLYQIRGRVGRSKERAYCYLIIPKNIKLDKVAEERLRIIQENTSLGSGFKVASHDLELRGAGSILGEDQSGHVNAVGYDLYVELLDNALKEAKGEKTGINDVEPDINIPIPAFIPDKYIQDIRTRLAYYKAMSDATSSDDMSKIEEELRDQFGKIPEEVINLMGIMLIRSICKKLFVKDIKAGKQAFTLTFSTDTQIKIENLIDLAVKQPSRYRITPDHRLVVQLREIEWSNILQEMERIEEKVGQA